MNTVKLNFVTYDTKGITGKVADIDKTSKKFLLGVIFAVIVFFLLAYSRNGSNMGMIGLLAIGLIAYYIAMERINERKLKDVIVPSHFK